MYPSKAEAPMLWPPDMKSRLRKGLWLGKIEGRKRSGQQRMRWLDGTIDSMDVSLSKLGETVKDRKPSMCIPWSCRVERN